MANEQYQRTSFLLSEDTINQLHQYRVAIFGAGGVGGYVIESLARSGIGTLDIIDHDTFALSNLNRQILATHQTIDCLKVDVAKQRVHDIDPNITVHTYPCFYLPEQANSFPFDQYDYIVDAIDTVTAKINLILQAQKHHVPIISSMGCGNRIDPTKLVVTDLYKTINDPLAKVMRHECKQRGIRKLQVVYSTELPIKPIYPEEIKETMKKPIPGSTAFVPSCAGIIIGSVVVRNLIKSQPH